MANQLKKYQFLDDRPARNRLKDPPIAFTAHGFQSVRLKGGEGDYFDVIMPAGEVTTMPFFSLFESGGIECVNEADGLWYCADADHPYSVRMLLDGTVLENVPHMKRTEGRTRMFLRPNTSRLCIYPVNVFEQPSLEPIEFSHVKGPLSVWLKRDHLFVLSVGTAIIDGQERSATVPYSNDLRMTHIDMKPGSYGAIAWKL